MRSLLLVALFALGAAPAAALSAEIPQQIDPAIGYALEQRILYPEADGTFNGDGRVTRVEFTLATMNLLYPNENMERCLQSIAASPDSAYTLLFNDVARDAWFSPQLCAAMRAGLVHGHADGNFRPFASITAAEASKIVAKAYGILPSPRTEPWYRVPMLSLSMRGGIGGGVRPGALLTRSQMAQMFYATRGITLPRAWATGQPSDIQNGEEMSTPPRAADGTDADGTMDAGTSMDGCGEDEIWVRPRTGVRVSRRVLQQEVELSYQMAPHRPSLGAPSNCTAFSLRSPGAASLAQGIVIPRRTEKYISTRALRAVAEQRVTGTTAHPTVKP